MKTKTTLVRIVVHEAEAEEAIEHVDAILNAGTIQDDLEDMCGIDVLETSTELV